MCSPPDFWPVLQIQPPPAPVYVTSSWQSQLQGAPRSSHHLINLLHLRGGTSPSFWGHRKPTTSATQTGKGWARPPSPCRHARRGPAPWRPGGEARRGRPLPGGGLGRGGVRRPLQVCRRLQELVALRQPLDDPLDVHPRAPPEWPARVPLRAWLL